MAKIYAPQINAVLKAVVGVSNEGDEQLTILAYALAIAIKSCQVDHAKAHEVLDIALNTPMTMVVLDDAVAQQLDQGKLH